VKLEFKTDYVPQMKEDSSEGEEEFKELKRAQN
jgi:hypothetical protein